MKHSLLCLAILAAIISNSTSAQWVHANGPCLGVVDALTHAPNPVGTGTSLFAGTTGYGVFLSTNDGVNWNAANNGLSTAYVYCLTVSDTNIFAGTYYGGVFRSSITGTRWTAVNKGLTNLVVRTLAASFSVSGTLSMFAGTAGDGVFQSIDRGSSWAPVNTGLASTYVYSLLLRHGMPATLFAGTRGGIFRSTDNGANWTSSSSGLTDTTVYTLALSPDTQKTLFAGTASGVFVSTDSGATWTLSNNGLTRKVVNAIGTGIFGGTVNVFAATDSGGIFRSTNKGSSWIAVNTGMKCPRVSSLDIAPAPDTNGSPRVLAGTNLGGVYLSTNRGASWSSASSGISAPYVYAFAATPGIGPTGSTLIAGSYLGGVAISTDSGACWSTVNTGLTNVRILSLAASSDPGGVLFAGSEGGGAYISTDEGSTWISASNGLTDLYVRSLLFTPSLSGYGPDVFAGISTGLSVSYGGTGSWVSASNGLPNTTVYALGTDGSSLFVGTGKGVYRSIDHGKNWSSIGLANSGIRALAVIPAGVGTGTRIFAGNYFSTDTGASWTNVGASFPKSVYSLAVSSSLSGGNVNVFAGLFGGGVYVSSNFGSSWTAVNEGATFNQTFALAVQGRYLLAGTECGVWRRPLAEMVTSVAEFNKDLPGRFALEQNFPNPFNPSTTIRFQTPEKSHVRLTIFNILGERVAVVADEVMGAGQYERIWNASSKASGVYFCRFEAGTYVEVKKLMLMK